MLEPPRAGLTNTGQPSSAISSSTRLRSAAPAARRGAASPGRGPPRTARPAGPRAAKISFMYSLSMPAALASTPAPTYGTPAISSRPWMRAVLAVGAVQQRQHHVDLAEAARHLARAR